MPIATIGAEIEVTPGNTIEIVHRNGNSGYEEDRTPFTMRVEDILREDGSIVGVVGPVVSGASRYMAMVANLFTRLDGSQWETDLRSAANFKVGVGRAHRVA